MGLLDSFQALLPELQEFFAFLGGFWAALPLVIRLLCYLSFGGVLTFAILKVFTWW